MSLGGLHWPELRGRRPVALLPLGATEQHGPHLPLATDTLIACAIAETVAERRDDAVVAPALPYGSSGEHAGFPGTLSLGQAAVELAVVELVRSADHFRGVVLVSWHGGNAGPVRRAVARLQGEGRRTLTWEPRLEGGDLHAGRLETSLMLAISPELVGPERPAGDTRPASALLPELRTRGVRRLSSNGVLGDAAGASAAEGRAVRARLADDLDAVVSAVAGSPVPT